MMISWTLISVSPRSDRNLGKLTFIEKSRAPRNNDPLPIAIAIIWTKRLRSGGAELAGSFGGTTVDNGICALLVMARDRHRGIVRSLLMRLRGQAYVRDRISSHSP